MTKNQKEELKAWYDQARSGVRRKIDCMKEEFAEMTAYDRVLEAMDELISENDDLSDKVESQQTEIDELPVRLLTLNNTVANLAERLANTDGKHAFSFTPEADTVAQKWKSSINDFSVMLRQSYDGSPYDREARSAEAVNVHIDHLLWNVTRAASRPSGLST